MAPSEAWIWGIATLTMLVSMISSKAPTATAAAIAHLLATFSTGATNPGTAAVVMKRLRYFRVSTVRSTLMPGRSTTPAGAS